MNTYPYHELPDPDDDGPTRGLCWWCHLPFEFRGAVVKHDHCPTEGRNPK